MSANFTPEQKNYNDYKTFEPFKMFVLQNFPFIAEDFDSLTYYQMLCKVVEYLKDTIDNNKLIQENQNEVLNAYNQLQEYINNYFINLDVQNEINNKLDEMATTGVLQDFISDYFSAVRNEFNTRLDNQNTALINTQNDVNTLESRMNNFTSLSEGSTTGDAELQDIRVGYDGNSHATAGDSVRNQISNIHRLLGVDVYNLSVFGTTELAKDVEINVTSGTTLYAHFKDVVGGTMEHWMLYGFKADGTYTSLFKTTDINNNAIIVTKEDYVKIRLYMRFLERNELPMSAKAVFGVVQDNNNVYKNISELKSKWNFENSNLKVTIGDVNVESIFPTLDFNNIHDFKTYFFYNCTKMNNAPVTKLTGQFFTIPYIIKEAPGTYQCFIDADKNEMYIRCSTGTVANTKWTPWSKLLKEEDLAKTLHLNTKTAKIFKKVCCVGDSFTAGYIVDNDGSVHPFNEDYAWPHYMATSTGNEYHNCGVSGANAKTWMSDAKGLAKAQAYGNCQAYIVGLALNDASNSDRGLTIGTSSDIGTENETYYAQYSKLIRELHTISPKAKIFVQTVPNASATYEQYNQAIIDIATAYADTYNVHVLDLRNYSHLYNTSSITGDAKSGHYTAIGYQQFAENLEYILSDYINNHITDFQDVAFI